MVDPRRIRQPQRRSCPTCGNHGFSRTGTDYLGRTEFRCHSCFQEWAAERGPRRGTGLDNIAKKDWTDD